MHYQQYGVIVLLLALVAGLIFSKRSPALWFGGALLLSYLVGWLPLEKALQNFANPSLVTLLLLLLVSIAIEKSQLVTWLSQGFQGKRLSSVIARLSLSSALMSAFINNTAVVATLMSSLRHHNHFAASKLLLPLSYSAILGGMLTLIGTSTNLIVNGFIEQSGEPVLGFFDFTLLGALVLAAGIVVLIIGSRWLPDNRQQDSDATPYYLTAHVRSDSQLIGKSVEQNQLRELQALFLAEIQRGKERICPVTPETVIEAGDELRFVGDIAAVTRLQQFPGLDLLRQDQQQGELLEAVLSYSSRLVGKSLKQLRFRHEYDAVVIAVRRGHERLQGGLGDLVLHAGDVLILSVGKHFPGQHQLNQEFVYVNGLSIARPLSQKLSNWVLLGFLAALSLSIVNIVPLIKSLPVLLLAYVAIGAVNVKELKNRFPLELWLIVGSAIGLAQLMIQTGVAGAIAEGLITLVDGSGAYGALVAVFIATWLFTELVTNNAAAALTFPIAYAIAQSLSVDPVPFFMAVAFGASASFISPFGYQTNLMVYSAGNYQLKDYLRLGIPMALTYSAVVLIFLPIIYPFK
ncbi:SLC13 family permease [Rheinheimera baltica]|uniref:SLC13 family permease n=1 Tax=Rheinheimera baltica TaxID=67576 RepID=UPI0004199929|nr:SLC13 family permease [Rheinheimera baltica]MDP5143631.1 SLC13 family permease [Rheinheimera baltica]MDP5151011.1 SLC13 family permease [Rheinheimera baltica]MDP5189592.1 SLC13 family permease [Rheinheimera baltica]